MTVDQRAVWRVPGMSALFTMTGIGFAGFALLMPAAPLWAARGGADPAGAGLVTATMMLFTVLAQPLVNALLRGVGWRDCLVLGVGLLGAPSLVQLFTDGLPWLLAVAALRGVGFGIITVCGALAVAELIEPGRRGRAIGVYGLASAGPQFVLVPLAPWLAEHVGFWVVFVLGAGPVLAIWPAVLLARHLAPPSEEPAAAGSRGVLRRIARPIGALLVITAVGGCMLTFVPQVVADPDVALVALSGFTGASALCRWRFGALADRYGSRRFVVPLLVVAAGGVGLIGWAVATPSAAVLVTGMVLAGMSHGGLQNLTLVQAFADAGERSRGMASTAWNIGFDAGTGVGALLVGYLATVTSFPTALAVLAALCLAAAIPVAIPPRTR